METLLSCSSWTNQCCLGAFLGFKATNSWRQGSLRVGFQVPENPMVESGTEDNFLLLLLYVCLLQRTPWCLTLYHYLDIIGSDIHRCWQKLSALG